MGEIQVSGTATVTGLVEFTGVQFGPRRFCEHQESIDFRRTHKKEYKNNPDFEPYYALPGCGLWHKGHKKTAELSELIQAFYAEHGSPIFFGK